MKKIIFFIFLTIFLSSCFNKNNENNPSISSGNNIEISNSWTVNSNSWSNDENEEKVEQAIIEADKDNPYLIKINRNVYLKYENWNYIEVNNFLDEKPTWYTNVIEKIKNLDKLPFPITSDKEVQCKAWERKTINDIAIDSYLYTACAPKNYHWFGNHWWHSDEDLNTNVIWIPDKENSEIHVYSDSEITTISSGEGYDYKEISKYKNILIIDYFDAAKKYKKTIIKVSNELDLKFVINKELPEHKRFLETFHIQKR